MDGGEKRCGILRISCGDAPPAPEMQEGVLHPMLLAGDGRFDALPAAVREDPVGVMGPIRQQRPGIHPLDQDVSLAAIRRGACCSNRSERQTMHIHGQLQFRVEPPLVRLIA